MALASCSSSKTLLPYFTDLEESATGTLPVMDYLPTVQPDDELLISVSSPVPEAAVQYNLPFTNPASRDAMTTATTPRYQTYVVDSKGDIVMPILGTIHVGGLNVEQIKDMLTQKLSSDINDPLVQVTLINFYVSVAGEVKSPQRIKVTDNRMSVLDALSAAGDLTEYGERRNVIVIREENGKRTYAHLDLNSSDVLTSPYYYVRQNDYIYVAPNSIRQANSKYNQNNAFKLSVVSTIVSGVSVIASLIIALTR
ncbi:MAG: polysaccharide biosynthesis/export family protein [Muribaculaceae bacterium]|nr:polysaccharide biosynthesis/export family protein [Muribaculaceae bacterium]